MPNGTNSQVQFRYQRPADAIYRVGPVGTGMFFTSIQAAITQAVADGFTDNSNPATIEIYPGTYTEDLTLNAGVHLKGMGAIRNGTDVVVVGTVTLTLAAGALATNITNLFRISVMPPAGANALVFTGASPGRLNARECVFAGNAAGPGALVIQSLNSNASSTLRLTDCIVQTSNALDNAAVSAAGACAFEMYGGQGGINAAGVTGVVAIETSATAVVRIFMNSTAISGSWTNCLTVGSAGSVIEVSRSSISNSLAAGNIVNFTANGNARLQGCGLFVASSAGKIGNGSTGNLLMQGCRFSGSISAPNATVDPLINTFNVGSTQVQFDNIYKEFVVGRGVGYPTIQAAITAAAAASAGNRKVVKIPPGNFTENLTLAPNVDLVADTFDLINSSQTAPVTINGVHTLDLGNGENVNIKGIRFNSNGVNSTPLFDIGGAGSGSIRFERCRLSKIFAGATKLVDFVNSGGSQIVLDECYVNFQADSGVAFDFSGSAGSCQLTIQGNSAPGASFESSIAISPTIPGTPTPLPLFSSAPSGSTCQIFYANIAAESTQLFTINGNDTLYLQHSRITQNVIEGELIKYNLAAFNIYISECTIDQLVGAAPNGLPCIARDDGTPASATITVDTNPAPGDSITVNGVELVADTDFAIGGTTSDTADNIRNAINASLARGIAALIYARTTANVVDLVAFADAAGNAYTLASSVPLVLIPSGANFAGGADGVGGNINMGVNSIHGQSGGSASAGGGAVVALPLTANQYFSDQVNEEPISTIAVQEDGVVEVPAAEFINFAGDGVTVTPSGTGATATFPGQANANEYIVGTEKGQYATIQLALDAAFANYPTRGMVLVNPGSYAEDLTLRPQVDLVARSYDEPAFNSAPVTISGNHSFTPTATGESILLKGINFVAAGGASMFEIVASAFDQGVLEFRNCNLLKLVNEADPMFQISNVNNCQMRFNFCVATHVTDSGATFDIADGSQIFWYGGKQGTNNVDLFLANATIGVLSTANLLNLGVSSQAFITKARITCAAEQAILLDDSSIVEIQYSTIVQNTDAGELIQYAGTNGLVHLSHNNISVSNGAGDSVLLGRDGVQADGTVTVDTVPTAGDTLTVNGVVFTAVNGAAGPDEFQVDGGATVDDVANNIRDAINASVSVGIDMVVYARSLTNVVTITARVSGTAGNAITLATSVPLVLLLSGATLSGGVDGAGGQFIYNLSMFPDVTDIEASISANSYATVVASV